MQLKSVVVLNNERIKNIWAVTDVLSLKHLKIEDQPEEVQSRKKSLSRPNKGPGRNEYWLDSIEIRNFNIIVELKNGIFLDNISLALIDPKVENGILPFRPIVSQEEYSANNAEYVIDYFINPENCDSEDEVIYRFETFMRDFEKRIESIHIENQDPRTGIVNKEEQLCLCFIHPNLKEVAKVKMRYGQ